MKMSEIRREKLRLWFSTRSLPVKRSEKSYISQLLHGKSSFGEKAARRLEATHGMGYGYLDTPIDNADSKVVDEFAWVYNHCSQDGRSFLENAVKVAAEAFVIHKAQQQK